MMNYFFKLLVKKFANQGIDKQFPFLVGLFKKVYGILSPDVEFLVDIPLDSKIYVSGKDSGLGLFLRTNKTFEPIQTKKFINSIKNGNVVFDIGANVGYYTVIASKLVGNKGKVYAFEPDKRNFNLLKRNLFLNNCQNVEIINKAIGAKNKTAFLKLDSGNFGESTLSEKGNVPVEIVTLDSFCRSKNIKIVDLIKIDVEGGEKDVLSGGNNLFEGNQRTKLFMECNPESLKNFKLSFEDLIVKIKNTGFSIKEIIDENKKSLHEFGQKALTRSLQESGFVGLYAEKEKSKKITKEPLVTVLMTAYNAEKFIKEALASIIKQTYSNLEIIVVDDGSIDGTFKIINEFKARDKRIRVFKMNKNSGPSVASNFGIRKAKGEFIARMDADDISFPDRIEKQVKFLKENPEVILVGGQCILINEKGNVIGKKSFPTRHQDIYNSLFSVNAIQHPSCMVNMRLLPKNKFVYHNHSILAHDLELVFELSQYGKLANLENTVLFYRQYPSSLSLKNPKKTFKATIEIREKAVRRYGYKPNFTGRMVNVIQKVLVGILPEKYIYSIFMFLRGAKKFSFFIPQSSPKSSILVLSK